MKVVFNPCNVDGDFWGLLDVLDNERIAGADTGEMLIDKDELRLKKLDERLPDEYIALHVLEETPASHRGQVKAPGRGKSTSRVVYKGKSGKRRVLNKQVAEV